MPNKQPANNSLSGLDAFDPESDALNVIVETPKGSRYKFKYDEEQRMFKLGKLLPAGMSFPYDFGFIPSTRGGDGDPLDVLVLMDEPAFAGCLVPARLIGVIEAEQTEEGETQRNDRLIAIAVDSNEQRGVERLDDLSPNLLDQIEHFFVSYNEQRGKEFKPLGRSGPEWARELVDEGIKRTRGLKRSRPAPKRKQEK